LRLLKAFLLGFFALSIGACSGQRSDGIDPSVVEYFQATKDHTIDSWDSDIRSTVYLTGFAANAITALHLIGVWIDTAVVVEKSKSLALGIGAIKARELNCPQLLHADDYEFIQALWVAAVSEPQLRSAFLHAKKAQGYALSGTDAARQLAVKHLLRAIEEKIGFKVAGKVLAKFGIKVVLKKLAGFAPIFGGLIAVAINKLMFMDPIYDSSITYFNLKAEAVCR
jgi:hypothetical protein